MEAAIAAVVGDVVAALPAGARRAVAPALPELSEPEILRHYIRCSQMTYGYDSGNSMGLGTCTMKYSPRVDEQLAKLPRWRPHPLQPEDTIQGILEIMYRHAQTGCASWPAWTRSRSSRAAAGTARSPTR